jgi:hypothetical protein
MILSRIYVCDYRRGFELDLGFIDDLHTPLKITLYRSLIHKD